ncbi:MAG TPA: hypothetical protein DEQ38_00240 [Elusimicrobia bacterium]|nr:MAG: hypothetical protein A2089_12055 [Elusimicrobia bacterium GWD2_63_28]HCC46542.1 hypothetical protein [Elusimicrobiota bacterium]
MFLQHAAARIARFAPLCAACLLFASCSKDPENTHLGIVETTILGGGLDAGKVIGMQEALVTPNDALAEIVGKGPMTRAALVSGIQVYVKENGLKDKKNSRIIRPDEKLGRLFAGKKQVSIFELSSMIENNLKR